MANYITKDDQVTMVNLINQFYDNEEDEKKCDIILNELFTYADKIINGIIFAPRYAFWRFCPLDDLLQDARMAIFLALKKRQFNQDKGNIFNFFSVVVSNNLKNTVSKINKHRDRKSDADITKLYNNETLTYNIDFDKQIFIDGIFGFLDHIFINDKKMLRISKLFRNYAESVAMENKRIVKKHFVAYCSGHLYSAKDVNGFFSKIKEYRENPQIVKLFEAIYE